jgi:hypothetical protein
VRSIIIYDGQLKVAVERRGGDLLPHSIMLGCGINRRIDLNHVVRGRRRFGVGRPCQHIGAREPH